MKILHALGVKYNASYSHSMYILLCLWSPGICGDMFSFPPVKSFAYSTEVQCVQEVQERPLLGMQLSSQTSP